MLAESAQDEIDQRLAPPPGHASAQTLPLDFRQRVFALREQLDEPCTFATYRTAMRDMARINRWTRGYRPALDLLAGAVSQRGVTHEPLRVVDLGCAHGDQLRAIHRWASRRSLPLRLTGIDLHPYAARLARQQDRREHISAGMIEWMRADFLAAELPPADIVLANLVAHHLSDADVVKLLRICAGARVGFLITDLRRSRRAARLFHIMSGVLRMNPMVRHDGVVSFHRAFALEEWRALVERAGIDATVADIGYGRVAVSHLNA